MNAILEYSTCEFHAYGTPVDLLKLINDFEYDVDPVHVSGEHIVFHFTTDSLTGLPEWWASKHPNLVIEIYYHIWSGASTRRHDVLRWISPSKNIDIEYNVELYYNFDANRLEKHFKKAIEVWMTENNDCLFKIDKLYHRKKGTISQKIRWIKSHYAGEDTFVRKYTNFEEFVVHSLKYDSFEYILYKFVCIVQIQSWWRMKRCIRFLHQTLENRTVEQKSVSSTPD